jgi:hypothetical protein
VEDFRNSKRARLTQQERHFVEETQVEQRIVEEPREEQKENSGAGRGPSRNDKAARRATRTKIVNSKVSIEYDPAPAARLAHDKFVREQARDAKCKKIRERLARSKEAEPVIHKWFFEKEGLLMRRFEPRQPPSESPPQGQEEEKEENQPDQIGAGEALAEGQPEREPDNGSGARVSKRAKALARVRPLGKIVVPAALIPDVLVMFHGVPITGHYGRDKTIHHISTYFWWKSLTKDVVDRVKGCHVCQMRKQTRPKRHMPPGGCVATAPM